MPLTATFAPSLGIPLAAFCTETLGWRWTFWLVIPPAAVAAVMVWRGLAAGPAQAGALPCVRLARPAAGRARAGHAGHRPAAGRAPGLAQLAADPRAAGRRRRADGPVPAERVVPPAAVLQDPAAAQPQPQPLAAHAGRRAGGAAGRDPDPFELPGAAARLPATGNRAGAAGHGPAPADRAAVGGRAVQPAPGRLPLGAGRRPACWRCHARWARS